MTKFKRSFVDPAEFDEAKEAAETLGFDVVKLHLHGTWDAEGEPFFGDYADEVVKTGSKYFHLRMDVDTRNREVWRCEPRTDNTLPDGELVVTFED